MNFSYFWGRKSNKGSDKGRYFDGVDDAVSKAVPDQNVEKWLSESDE